MNLRNLLPTDALNRKGEDLVILLDHHGQASLAPLLASAKARHGQAKLVIPVIGTGKRGKSTLINALLGRADDTLAPIGELQTSNVCTRFERGPENRGLVRYVNGETEAISFDVIRNYVTESANPDNRRGVQEVEITSPEFPLPDGLVLMDTPGAGSVIDHHNEFILRIIPQADAVIYMVTADDPINATEQKLLRELKKEHIDKIFFVVNRKDAVSRQDLLEGIEHNRRVLAGLDIKTRIHPISARLALNGLPDSGVPELFKELADTSLKQRLALKSAAYAATICEIAKTAEESIATELALAGRSREELDRARQDLDRDRRSLDQTAFQEAEFLRETNTAIFAFENALPRAEVEAKRRVQAHLDQVIGADFDAFWKRIIGKKDDKSLAGLSLFIANACEAEIEPLSKTLGEGLGRAAARLAQEFSAPDLAGVAPQGIDHDAGGLDSALGAYTKPAALIGGAFVANLAGTAAITSVASSVGGLLAGLPLVGGLASSALTGAAAAGLAVTIGTILTAGCVVVGAAGVLGLPIAWRNAQLKTKEAFSEKARQVVSDIFWRLRTEGVPRLRQSVETALQSARETARAHLAAREAAVARAEKNAGDVGTRLRLQAAHEEFRAFRSGLAETSPSSTSR